MATSSEALRTLTQAIQRACAARTWSRGVLLARDGTVEGIQDTGEEITLSVCVPERPVPLSIILYPETIEWDCDCAASIDCCAHVAAAAIALGQARQAGRELPTSARPTVRLRYVFRREGKVLLLERLRASASGETSRVAGPLASARLPDGTRITLSDADLALEPLIAEGFTTVTHPEQVAKLLSELSHAAEVFLVDQPVRTSTEKVLPIARVTGDENRLVLSIVRDPSIDEVIADGIARVQDVLRPLGEVGLTGARLEKLPIEIAFRREAFAELVGETIPLYGARFPVEIATRALPVASGPIPPRIDLRIQYGAGSVAVAPELVYGNPPKVRIEDRRAIYLGSTVPERDHAAERRLVERLRSELNLVNGRRVEVHGPEAASFLRKVRAFELEGVGTPAPALIPSLVPRIRFEGDRWSIGFAIEGDPDHVAALDGPAGGASQVLRAFESGEETVPLLGGGWGALPRAWLEENADRVALVLQHSGEDGRVATPALPALAQLLSALDEPLPADLERLRPLFEGFDRLPHAVLPQDLRAELRPYQQHGVDALAFLRDAGLGVVLADDMGLGKTIQALSVLRGRTLIVCPTSVLPNWAAEIARFRPALRVSIYHGPTRALDETADVTLTTYALLRGDEERLGRVRWGTAILDEAQAIKNAESQTARAAYALQADFRLTLTGTPVENRLEELWSQLHFTNPGVLGGRAEFSSRFSRPIGAGDASAAARLRDRIRPFVIRRLKKDVARDLPPRTEMVLRSELEASERAIYDAVLLATRTEVVAKLASGSGVLAVLEALLRLRQACCHSGLVPGHEAQSSSKIDTLLEVLSEVVAEGHKALVFSQWTSLLDRVEPHLGSAELPFLRLDGSTKDRGEVVARFQAPDGPPVLLISLKAGGTGLNLTAADHVFLLDPWWNPAVEDQAADRAHRIGQDRPVIVHRLVARDTVEERILDLQVRKRALADAALAAGSTAALTREDLLALFE